MLWLTAEPLVGALAVSATLFYVFVYTIWLKPRSLAEHRDRRRGGRGAGPRGLGRGHREPRGAGVGALRDRLLLDASPLLGPRTPVPRRLRRRRLPDAPGRHGQRGRDPPDPGVLVVVRRGQLALPFVADDRADLSPPQRYHGRCVPLAGGAAPTRSDSRRAIRSFMFSNTYLALVFAAVAVDTLVRAA